MQRFHSKLKTHFYFSKAFQSNACHPQSTACELSFRLNSILLRPHRKAPPPQGQLIGGPSAMTWRRQLLRMSQWSEAADGPKLEDINKCCCICCLFHWLGLLLHFAWLHVDSLLHFPVRSVDLILDFPVKSVVSGFLLPYIYIFLKLYIFV